MYICVLLTKNVHLIFAVVLRLDVIFINIIPSAVIPRRAGRLEQGRQRRRR